MESIRLNKSSIATLIGCFFLFGLGYISGTFYMGKRLAKEAKVSITERYEMRKNLTQQNKGE